MHRRLFVAVLAMGIAGSSATAQAKQTVYPVKITIKAKPAPRFACQECYRFAGTVSSPKPVCERNREVIGKPKYPKGSPHANTIYKHHLATADAQGRWKVVTPLFEPLAKMTVIVETKRLSDGAICRAASATFRF